MIERDSVEIEKDRVRRRKRNKKLGPKPWQWHAARLKRTNFWRRIHWSRKRWARYHEERDIKREAWPRTLKAIRLRREEEAAAAAWAAERRRLSAERRRAARAAAAKES